MKSNYTQEDFIRESKELYGDKYTYEKVIYKNKKTNVIITCPFHGDFPKRPLRFLKGVECTTCSRESRRYTTEEFIKKCSYVHHNYYDYSKTIYTISHANIIVTCPIHGDFELAAYSHIAGKGCSFPICYKNKQTPNIIPSGRKARTTNLNFVDKAKEIHGNTYNYSKTNYERYDKEVTIICAIHGPFEQKPVNHLVGHGCNICGLLKLSKRFSFTTEQYIEKAKKVYGDKYDYSLVDYINSKNKIKLICSIHGIFPKYPFEFLAGHGCQKCSKTYRYNTDEYIEKAIQVHGTKYDYSETVYINNKLNVKVICPDHGEFFPNASHHIRGVKCMDCAREIINNAKRFTLEQFINLAVARHGSKYDYSLVEYINIDTNITIICSKHGQFPQTPYSHIRGAGCSRCKESKGERKVVVCLENLKIDFITQKKFKDCKKINCLPFDFYLPNFNLLIEYDGRQHFEIVEFFGGEKGYLERVENDKIKNNFCKENNIPLLRIKYNENVKDKLTNWLEEMNVI